MRADATFRAMGTDAHLIVTARSPRTASAALDRGRERVEELEALWSRFRPASEVSVLNALAGIPVSVSPETVALVQRALDGVRLTGGLFDPTVLGAVVRAGYDRTYADVDPLATTDDTRTLGAPLIEVDPVALLVRLPEGVGFDPGGIGKGLAADIVVRELAERVDGVCVNIGGDLRVLGDAPDPAGWAVEIEDPFGGPSRGVISLVAGAIATSSRTKRVLAQGHHLIDPSTGTPARVGAASATVLAGQGWIAEVAAKAAFLAGPTRATSVLEALGADGMVILDDGSERRSPGYARFLSGQAAA
jgi:thiamine biosynthesis lipoprotein